MRLIKVLIFVILPAISGSVRGADYSVINQLPDRLRKLQLESHKEWDTGVTPRMKEATDHYNDVLAGFIKVLVKKYYPEKWMDDDSIKNYEMGLYTVHEFEHLAQNPSGEFQGTIATLDVPSSVMVDLNKMISDMVQSITADDSKFDYKAWKKRWVLAGKTGD